MKTITDKFTVLAEDDLPFILRREPARITSNPLRLGEPARLFGAQTHIWGEQPSASDKKFKEYIISKEIQNISICIEDIQHLIGLIKILPQASDYSNKLIGKYIIIEIHNILSCIKNLSRASYDIKISCQQFAKNIKKLDKKYYSKTIRDKIVAHKHNDKQSSINLTMKEQADLWGSITSKILNEYIMLIHNFAHQLQTLATIEYRIMIQSNGTEIKGILAPLCGDDYNPFYEETKNWTPAESPNRDPV
jgi:hypothetical protein